MPYTITEPHPTVQANAYTHSGRGGAGNTFRAPTSVTPAAGVPMPLTKVVSGSSVSGPTSGRFHAGRGGAGNAYPASARISLSLDGEYAYAAAVAKATTLGHVGRGGAGNVYSASKASAVATTPAVPNISTADRLAGSLGLGSRGAAARKGSDASSSSSDSSSSRSGFWGRLHHH